MNHVDRGDQLRASLGYNHRIRRGPWQALAWTFLLEIALVNSYLLQLHGNPSWKRYKSQAAWRSCIVDALIAAFSPGYKGRKLYRSGHDNLSHPDHQLIYRGRTKNSRCHACLGHRCGVARSQAADRALASINGNRGKKKASQSRYGCELCDVPLCNSSDLLCLEERKVYAPPPMPKEPLSLVGFLASHWFRRIGIRGLRCTTFSR